MKTYVLDASALLRFLNNEPGGTQVEHLINEAIVGTVELMMSAANWSEVLHLVLKHHGNAQMIAIESKLQSLPIRILVVDPVVSKTAAEFRYQHKVPFADSFAGAAAEQNRATLVTADYDFHGLTTSFKIHLLPTKAKRTP